MTAETERNWRESSRAEAPAEMRRRLARTGSSLKGVSAHGFSSLSRRIVVLNLCALLVLLSGFLFMNQFREGLIDARVQSLLTQGEIIAAAIAASATTDAETQSPNREQMLELEAGESLLPGPENLDPLEFPINPEKVAPILRRLILPTGTRARIYDRDGILLLDSRHLYSRGQILRFDLPPADAPERGLLEGMWRSFLLWVRRGDLPLYEDLAGDNGLGYPEVQAAMTGSKGTFVRVNDRGEIVISVAVPVTRFRAVLGVLLFTTQGGDIDAVLHAERLGVVRVFLVAALVTIVLSIVLASTIAGPVRRLADGAERVRRSIKARTALPDFSHRRDEIGHLSGTLHDMTDALYDRIEAIESFAADVAHELKNPLTSLKSAVETLPLATSAADRKRLIEIARHDVRRLDRLISDISDASRLDAELAREDAEPVDLVNLMATVVSVLNDTRKDGQPQIELAIHEAREGGYVVSGHASRLGQVLSNLLANARSFSPPGGHVRVIARCRTEEIEICVEDEGPGIAPENLERVFNRFYTDRPDREAFGQNSGLGLSISRQIVESHGGRIWAENIEDEAPADGRKAADAAGSRKGARFVVRLPAG